MTPLYDVVSAQPNVEACEIRRNQFRLAMAVGNNRQYRIDTIAPRHFLQTAQRAGMGANILGAIFEELRDTVAVCWQPLGRFRRSLALEIPSASA